MTEFILLVHRDAANSAGPPDWALDLEKLRSAGLVDTPANDRMPEARRDDMYRDAAASLPAGRVGAPEDIAEALLFLVRNCFVTGAVLDVYGGVRLGLDDAGRKKFRNRSLGVLELPPVGFPLGIHFSSNLGHPK